MSLASIVIPCYNAERFVEETIRSAQHQTIRDIEIICVDDGSTDGTLALLKKLASEDDRIRVIERTNGGEGPARDDGLVAAKSPWLYFLDSDDLMEPTLLRDAIDVCERDNSDICVFRTITVDVQTGEELPCWYSFQCDWLDGTSFSPRDYPEHVFTSFQNWVHNKLFRASFVHEHGLRMQHVHRTADLLFTCRALAEAERISVLDKPLHRYRVNNPQSALATSDSYPLDFYEAFLALRASLEEHGTWELYHDSFVNWAIHGVATNVDLVRSLDGFYTIVDEMQAGGLAKLDIPDFPREKSDNLESYDLVRSMVDGSRDEALFHLAAMRRERINHAENALSHLRMDTERALGCIRESVSFRVGRVITAVPRAIRNRPTS